MRAHCSIDQPWTLQAMLGLIFASLALHWLPRHALMPGWLMCWMFVSACQLLSAFIAHDILGQNCYLFRNRAMAHNGDVALLSYASAHCLQSTQSYLAHLPAHMHTQGTIINMPNLRCIMAAVLAKKAASVVCGTWSCMQAALLNHIGLLISCMSDSLNLQRLHTI